MRGWPITYSDFSGGLNTLDGPYLLEGNQARECLNVHTSQTGDIEKRNGFVTLSGASLTGSPINATGVHTLFPSNTTTKSLIGVATTASTDTVFKMTTAGVASALKTGLTANTRWYFAQAEVNGAAGPIFGLNGVDTPLKWNGEAAEMTKWEADTGEVPREAKYLTYWSSRLWCAEGSRLRASGITGSTPDPLNWDPEEFVDLEPNDGQKITGINVVGSNMIVTKSRKTYQIYDPVTMADRQLSNAIGCVSHRSMVQTPIGLFFLSEDQGVVRTDGNSAPTPFSDPIKPTLDQVAESPATAVNAVGKLEGRRYFLSLSLNGNRNDHTLEYDLVAGSWWLHDCAVNDFALVDPGGSPVLYSADAGATRISKAFVTNVFTDHGANYAGKSIYITPHYAWGSSGSFRYQRYINPHVVKRVREVRIDGVGVWESSIATNFTDDWELMQGEVWDQSGTAESGTFEGEGGAFEGAGFGTFEEAADIKIDRHYPTPGLGRAVSLKHENDDANNFKIYSQTIAIQMRDD